MATIEGTGSPVVYLPFPTFLTVLDTLGQGLPPRVDKSVFSSQSGSVQTQIMSNLKTMRLIDDDGVPQETLRRLAEERENRPALVADLLRIIYPEIVNLGASHGSAAQLKEAFTKRNAQGDTQRKAITFLLQAMEYSGLPTSRLWPKTKQRKAAATPRKNGNAAAPRKRRSSTQTESQTEPKQTQTPPPSAEGATRTVDLPSGGWVTLTVSVDPFSLTAREREAVFDLIDRVRQLPETLKDDRVTPAASAAAGEASSSEYGKGDGVAVGPAPHHPEEARSW
jgi:hypothetical protein